MVEGFHATHFRHNSKRGRIRPHSAAPKKQMASDLGGMTIDRLTADRTSYLYGQNGAYIAELYDQFMADPSSVDGSWATLFADLRGDADAILEEVDGPGWGIEAKQARVNGKKTVSYTHLTLPTIYSV